MINKCSERYLVGKKRTQSEFIEELDSINPNIETIGHYTTCSNHIQVKCKVCNHIWNPRAGSLLRGYGCPKCRDQKLSKKFSLSNEVFVRELSNSHPSLTPLGKYVNGRIKIKIKCEVCGHIWEVGPSSLRNGTGCPKCAGNLRYTTEQFKDKLTTISPEIEIIGEYVNAHTKIKCHCRICNNEWEMNPNNLQQGQKCPKCMEASRHIKQTKKHDDFIYQIGSINPNIEVLGKYKNAHTHIKCRCKACGYIWHPIANSIFRGNGCPRCVHSSTSFMEQFILHTFVSILGEKEVYNRDKSTIGFELDIYIPKFRLAIEPGSWYWHKYSVKRDREKLLKCREQGIRLITIYDAYDQTDKPLNEDCLLYDLDLGAEDGHKTLKNLIYTLLSYCKIDKKFSEEDWKKIESNAYQNSLLRSNESFIEEVSKINPKITILSRYLGFKNKVKCVCKICGYHWETAASHLLRGQGCPKCGGTMKKTHKEFVHQVSLKHPNIKVLGNYVNNRTKISVMCEACGNIWNVIPANLVYGFGCPVCAINNRTKAISLKAKEIFKNNMKVRGNQNVEVLGEYVNSNTKILCRCKTCGNEWGVTPKSLLAGHGCPLCARKMVTGRHPKWYIENIGNISKEFAYQVNLKHPNIEILDSYTNYSTKIRAKCKVCGHIFNIFPSKLLNKVGCPVCAKIKRARMISLKAKNMFEQKMKISGKTEVEVIGEYVNAKTKILCRCKICKNEWMVTPDHLTQGTGCPLCARKRLAGKRLK